MEKIIDIGEKEISNIAISAYLAGLIDGDGTIQESKVVIYNQDKQLVEQVQQLIERLTGFECSLRPYSYPNHAKPLFHLTICGKVRIQSLLSSILPFLIGKKLIAESVFQIISQKKTYNLRTLQKNEYYK